MNLQPMSLEEDRLAEAAEWLIELQECTETGLPPEQLKAWKSWIAVERNRLAFDQISALPASLREARRPVGVPGRLHRPSLARGALAATIATTAIGLGAYAALPVWRELSGAMNGDFYKTPAGVERTIHLGDGSVINLASGSSLSVRFTAKARSIEMRGGEALFTVARDPNRPFTVSAAKGWITALGTVFDVQRDLDRVIVTVNDGAVEVHPRAQALTDAPLRLDAGEQVSYHENGGSSAVRHASAKTEQDWRGALPFHREPLKYVITTLNRYSRHAIVFDSQAGELLYSGTVMQDQIDQWALDLPKIFPVEVNAAGRQVLVRARKTAAP